MSRARVLIVADGNKPAVRRAVDEARPWLEERVELLGVDFAAERDLEADDADLILSFGGDGSLLQTARRMGERQKPVVGINYGRLGFLADLTRETMYPELEWVLEQGIPTQPRMMLRASLRQADGQSETILALNDVVISQAAVKRMIEVSLAIGREEVTVYRGDGLIVATPVGSTAHSLSAGGPIVHPDMRALILTPICPHLLTNRPLIVPASERIKLHHAGPGEEAMLTIDGQENRRLVPGDEVHVEATPFEFRLVLTRRWTYYRLLQAKLSWGVGPQLRGAPTEDRP